LLNLLGGGQEISVVCYECVCVCILALVIWHAKCIFSVVCGQLDSIIFSTLSDDFSGKDVGKMWMLLS